MEILLPNLLMQGMPRSSLKRGLCCTTHRSLCSSLSSLGYKRFLTSQALYLEEEPARSRWHPHHHDETGLQSVHRNNHSPQPLPKIGRLVLVRHGQSLWNVTDPTRNLTARFTGWADIGLTQQGKDQAVAAGRAIKLAAETGILPSKELKMHNLEGHMNKGHFPAIDVAFCSLLKRASDTMNLILNEVHLAEPSKFHSDEYQYHIPVIESWRLNERHYGALVGLSKEGAERLYGKVRLRRWRDSWDVPPPPMPLIQLKKWDAMAHCQPVTFVNRGQTAAHHDVDDYASRESCVKILELGGKKEIRAIPNDTNEQTLQTFMPPSESLCNTYERLLPLWLQGITPHLRAGRTVLVTGHANTIRSMLFAIDPDIVNKENSKQVKIPSALPLVYEFIDAHTSRLLCMMGNDSNNTNGYGKDGNVYINGRECSKVVTGNLRVIKPLRHSTSYSPSHTADEVIYSDQVNQSKKEMKYLLNGVWVETEETKSISFCTDVGKEAGEQDIA